MKIEANVWQMVPGTKGVYVFPIITKPSIISSNCYIFSAPEVIVVVDPGASAEQSKRITQVLNEALAKALRPVWVFLTHCHQDHSQESGAFELLASAEVKRFAHKVGADALEKGDRNSTVAYLYPWRPEVCRARFDCKLFGSPQDSPAALELANGTRVELRNETLRTHDHVELECLWLPLGLGERLDIYQTPGHSPCSISLRIGSLLVLGDLPFAANPGLCGLDGWNHKDLMESLHKVDWLLDGAKITVCCPGHGYCATGEAMREKLRLMGEESRDLVGVDLMDARRIGGMKNHVDELLEETAALLTILSGRLYTVSYYLSVLKEERASEQILAAVDLDQIDRRLTEFRRFVETFNANTVPELTLVLKGVQVARSLQQILETEQVTRLLGLTIVRRAQRRLEDFLSAVRGLQFLNAERIGSVDELVAGIVRREKPDADADWAELLAAANDDQLFVDTLSRRLAAHSPLREVTFELELRAERAVANIGVERLDDILTGLIEGVAATAVKNIHVATSVQSDEVVIRLWSRPNVSAFVLESHRLALYKRTLGWLHGILEQRENEGNAEFIIRLPARAFV